METQQYLNPSQVEELRNLGVEFENTTDMWLSQLTDWKGEESKSYMQEWKRVRNDAIIIQGMATYKDLPCPSFQEVLEKLPSTIYADPFDVDDVDCFELTLRRDHVSDLWHCDYLDNFGNSLFNKGVGVLFGENPLLLGFTLLKLVATLYSGSLMENNN